MPVGVVEVFEAVDVGENDRHRIGRTLAAVDFPHQRIFVVMPVVDFRQGIVQGFLLQLLVFLDQLFILFLGEPLPFLGLGAGHEFP